MARHGSLADQLTALRKYVETPDHEPEPIQTNWAVALANENNPEDTEDLKHDRKRLVTPSVSEIMRNVATGEVERSKPTKMEVFVDNQTKTVTVPGKIIRVGRLRFSDGTQTEKAYRYTIDGKLEEYAARMPAGALLGARDKVDVALGGEVNPQEITDSNRYFSEMLDTKKARHLTGGRHKGHRLRLTHDEAKAQLAAAYANTDMSKVTFTRYPDGLPCGSAKVADSFIGMQKTTCAGGGSVMWQDIVIATADRKEWFDAVDSLKAADRAVLATVRAARTYADVAPGGSERGARKRGKRKLIAANDNLMEAIRKFAA